MRRYYLLPLLGLAGLFGLGVVTRTAPFVLASLPLALLLGWWVLSLEAVARVSGREALAVIERTTSVFDLREFSWVHVQSDPASGRFRTMYPVPDHQSERAIVFGPGGIGGFVTIRDCRGQLVWPAGRLWKPHSRFPLTAPRFPFGRDGL